LQKIVFIDGRVISDASRRSLLVCIRGAGSVFSIRAIDARGAPL